MPLSGSKLPLAKGCCWCGTLEGGSKFIGYYKLLFHGVFSIMNICIVLYFFMTNQSFRDHVEDNGIALFLTMSTWDFTEALFGGLLLLGVYMKNGSYVKTWVIIQSAYLTISFLWVVAMFIFIVQQNHASTLKILIAEFYVHLFISGFQLYLAWVVYSYYRVTYYRDNSTNLVEEEEDDQEEDVM